MRKSYLSAFWAAIFLAIAAGAGPVLILPADAADYQNPAVTDEGSPSYWIDRGGLFATYGNYSAAIDAYKKALALDPNRSLTYFNLALAYCEKGAYDEALTAMNRAVGMEPDNGRFLYGRGWILLQAKGADQARADFQKAAELGDADALDYLHGRTIKPSPGQ